MSKQDLKSYMEATWKLHQMSPGRLERYDTPEKEAAWEEIAEEMDPLWHRMSPEEKSLCERFSEALYALHDLQKFLATQNLS
jgi:hypothetical protein